MHKIVTKSNQIFISSLKTVFQAMKYNFVPLVILNNSPCPRTKLTISSMYSEKESYKRLITMRCDHTFV